MKNMQNVDLAGKRVLLRVDLNLPLESGKVLDATRAFKLKPTIDYLLQHGAKIILASHLGRPEGAYYEEFSLKQLLPTLEKLYQTPISFSANCIGAEPMEKAAQLKHGQILLLENLRFHPEEETNDEDWAKDLAQLAEIYINDAFACCHRKHASVSAITNHLPSYAGMLLQEEVANLQAGLYSAKHPVVAIIGGKKVTSKYEVLENIIDKVDKLMIAGAMANTFLAAMGHNLGGSFVEIEAIEKVKQFLARVDTNKIYLPEDFVINTNDKIQIVNLKEAAAGNIGDIGPKTIAHWCNIIATSKTVLWNGPLGRYENPHFSNGSNTIAKFIADKTINDGLYSLAGGGDVVAAIESNSLASSFSYISTAGGAFLDWLAGKEMPGLTALKTCHYV